MKNCQAMSSRASGLRPALRMGRGTSRDGHLPLPPAAEHPRTLAEAYAIHSGRQAGRAVVALVVITGILAVIGAAAWSSDRTNRAFEQERRV